MNISKTIIGFAVVGLVMTGAISVNAKENTKKSENAVCVLAAIERRENAFISALDEYHASLVFALKTRRDALKASLNLADKKAALATFRASRKSATATFKNAKNTIGDTFKADRKACK